MKKILLLVFIQIAFSNSIFSQIVESKAPDFNKSKVTAEEIKLFKYVGEVSFNPINALKNAGDSLQIITNAYLWPDSIPVITNNGKAEHVRFHSFGQVFNPSSKYFGTFAKLPRQSYYWNDLGFNFKYRNVDDRTDTLLIQFYDANQIANLQIGNNPTRSVVLNKNESKGISSKKEMRILLTSASNTPNFYDTVLQSFNGRVTLNNLSIFSSWEVAFTATYLPANRKVLLGDSLATDSAHSYANPLNCFMPLIFESEGVNSKTDSSFNLALMLYSAQKYSLRSPEWYFPENHPLGKRRNVYTDFNINLLPIPSSVSSTNNSAKIYPNPAQENEVVFLKLNSSINTNSQETVLYLFNNMGQNVGQFDLIPAEQQGEYSIQLKDVLPGMYYYSFEIEGQLMKGKLTVL